MPLNHIPANVNYRLRGLLRTVPEPRVEVSLNATRRRERRRSEQFRFHRRGFVVDRLVQELIVGRDHADQRHPGVGGQIANALPDIGVRVQDRFELREGTFVPLIRLLGQVPEVEIRLRRRRPVRRFLGRIGHVAVRAVVGAIERGAAADWRRSQGGTFTVTR